MILETFSYRALLYLTLPQVKLSSHRAQSTGIIALFWCNWLYLRLRRAFLTTYSPASSIFEQALRARQKARVQIASVRRLFIRQVLNPK